MFAQQHIILLTKKKHHVVAVTQEGTITEMKEQKSLHHLGEYLAVVCKRFFRVLAMEGTGVLKDRGKGRFTVNWAEIIDLKNDKCIHGEGVASLCLIPYHTIAADLKSHPEILLFLFLKQKV